MLFFTRKKSFKIAKLRFVFTFRQLYDLINLGLKRLDLGQNGHFFESDLRLGFSVSFFGDYCPKNYKVRQQFLKQMLISKLERGFVWNNNNS